MTFGDRFDKCSKISRTEFQHTSIAFISPWIHPMRKPPQRTLVRSGGSPPALRLLKEGGKVAKVICRREHPTLLNLMNRNERMQKTEKEPTRSNAGKLIPNLRFVALEISSGRLQNQFWFCSCCPTSLSFLNNTGSTRSTEMWCSRRLPSRVAVLYCICITKVTKCITLLLYCIQEP